MCLCLPLQAETGLQYVWLQPCIDVPGVQEMKEYELTPEQVEAYEQFRGFKTTGKVTMRMSDEAVWKLYLDMLTPKDIG